MLKRDFNSFKEKLKKVLRDDFLIVCLGNELRGDDGIGEYIAKLLVNENLSDKVLDLGMSPEALIGSSKITKHRKLIFIDAISANLPPGTVVFGEIEELEKRPILLTTHTVPLSLIVKYLRLTIPSLKAYLIGIQVKRVEIGMGISDEVLKSGREVANLILSLVKGNFRKETRRHSHNNSKVT